MLHVRTADGEGDGSIVALHGFTLTGAMFEPLASLLRVKLLAVDLPGHGRSPDATTLGAAVDGVIAVIADAPTPTTLLGYSMGGRLALRVALEASRPVDQLVVVSAGPGIGDLDERQRRAAADEALARRMEPMDVDRFLDEWLSNPLVGHADGVDVAAKLADRNLRRENDPKRLAAALLAMGQTAAPDVEERLDELAMRVLLVSGGLDEQYTDTMAGMVQKFHRADHVVIPEAGHNVVFDAPEALAAVLDDWIASAA